MDCKGNILIADAGSTKIRWTLLCSDGNSISFTSPGVNPLVPPAQGLQQAYREALSPNLPDQSIDSIYYYGAGCIPSKTEEVAEALRSAVDCNPEIFVASDLLGAARSLLGHDRGIAAVIGTGSIACLYDGSQIQSQIPALGFILGDEGSGAWLGKTLLNGVLKRQLPQQVIDRFNERYSLSVDEIIDNVYRRSQPNRFLASFAPFFSENRDRESLAGIVREGFNQFLRLNIIPIEEASSLPVRFTGSVAGSFSQLLTDCCHRLGLNDVQITADPSEGLIKYHQNIKS